MTITGRVTVNTFEFKYGEVSFGKGRGISLASGGHSQKYMIKPDPHKDPWYNKNQAKFYKECAESFGTTYTVAAAPPNPAQLNWPAGDATATVHGSNYQLQVR